MTCLSVPVFKRKCPVCSMWNSQFVWYHVVKFCIFHLHKYIFTSPLANRLCVQMVSHTIKLVHSCVKLSSLPPFSVTRWKEELDKEWNAYCSYVAQKMFHNLAYYLLPWIDNILFVAYKIYSAASCSTGKLFHAVQCPISEIFQHSLAVFFIFKYDNYHFLLLP